MARSFAVMERLDAGDHVAAAMRAHPDLIRGHGAADTMLMRALPGWTAKGGAEGLLCAASPDGVGVALKCEDGSSRGLKPALAAFLARLGSAMPEAEVVPIVNSRSERVGVVEVL
jgi:L-asparaginase II